MNERERLEQKIRDLTSQLTSSCSPIGDWKIAKYQEYLAIGQQAPYDINELHAQRQAIRDEINRTREEIENLPENNEQ
jgi:hypothetical protein